jgi:hypothetical protein
MRHALFGVARPTLRASGEGFDPDPALDLSTILSRCRLWLFWKLLSCKGKGRTLAVVVADPLALFLFELASRPQSSQAAAQLLLNFVNH